jgi:hypothetical protein
MSNAPVRPAVQEGEKTMTILARLQTSTHLAGLLIAAAIILCAPFGAAAALRDFILPLAGVG